MIKDESIGRICSNISTAVTMTRDGNAVVMARQGNSVWQMFRFSRSENVIRPLMETKFVLRAMMDNKLRFVPPTGDLMERWEIENGRLVCFGCPEKKFLDPKFVWCFEPLWGTLHSARNHADYLTLQEGEAVNGAMLCVEHRKQERGFGWLKKSIKKGAQQQEPTGRKDDWTLVNRVGCNVDIGDNPIGSVFCFDGLRLVPAQPFDSWVKKVVVCDKEESLARVLGEKDYDMNQTLRFDCEYPFKTKGDTLLPITGCIRVLYSGAFLAPVYLDERSDYAQKEFIDRVVRERGLVPNTVYTIFEDPDKGPNFQWVFTPL